MDPNDPTVLVFDIGKTHVKITLLDSAGAQLYQNRTSNKVKETQPYASHDINNIWMWFIVELSELAANHYITSISIATHGATAALVDPKTSELLLPIMDYEFEAYPDDLPDYKALRPSFDITGSPELPVGLNLGKQLHWQCQLLSAEQIQTAVLLLYPQYWAWRLTGVFSSEVTSLGCHTDLWNIKTNSPSKLLEAMGLQYALPPMSKAWEPLGKVKPELAAQTGLNEDCVIYPGIHDSNAGYLPTMRKPKDIRPTVISSGTWTIAMDSQASIDGLDPAQDMLINVDAEGSALVTARYMGGREFGLICERFNTDIATTFTNKDIQRIIDSNTFILPSFCQGTGPYPNNTGRILFENGPIEINGKAAATLYSALMVTDILNRLNSDSESDILVEGSFASNFVLCGLIAALKPERKLRIQNRGNGVTEGCFLITQWHSDFQQESNPKVSPYQPENLSQYAKNWREAVHQSRN
jgi:sugar (pentulose or hexulose) kinase